MDTKKSFWGEIENVGLNRGSGRHDGRSLATDGGLPETATAIRSHHRLLPGYTTSPVTVRDTGGSEPLAGAGSGVSRRTG